MGGLLRAWTWRPSPGSRTSCATAARRSPALGLKTGARWQRWSWSSSESCRPSCARLPLRVHGAERQGVSRGSEGEGGCRGRGLVLLALAWQADGTKGQLSQRGRSTFKPAELTEEQKQLI